MPKSVYTSLKNWFLKKIQHIKKGLGSKVVPVTHYEMSVSTHAHTDANTQTEQITNPSIHPGK